MDVSETAWLGGEKQQGKELVREQRREVSWNQGKRIQKQKRGHGEQCKLRQVEERIRVGAGWEDGNIRHRTKSLKQGRTALSRSGALKI